MIHIFSPFHRLNSALFLVFSLEIFEKIDMVSIRIGAKRIDGKRLSVSYKKTFLRRKVFLYRYLVYKIYFLNCIQIGIQYKRRYCLQLCFYMNWTTFRIEFDKQLEQHLQQQLATVQPYIFSDELKNIYEFILPFSA